jgi:5-formyltetrahydrofolate cyclo-ligase
LSTSPAAAQRQLLRRELRARRRAVIGIDRVRKARQLTARVAAAGWLVPGRRVGLFLSMPEEIDTAPLLRLAHRQGCRIALPRVISRRFGRMRFFDVSAGFDPASLRRGAFGIREPEPGAVRAARELDVVFMPLVGFDGAGHRIGMGGGYYDRHFAFRLRLQRCRRPLLIGLAYAAQQVPALACAAHDVPLDAIVTEYSTVRFSRQVP